MLNKYISGSAALENGTKKVSIKSCVLHATGAGGSATFRTGGAAGTIVGVISMATANDSGDFYLGNLRADYVTLSNATVNLVFE